MELVTVNIIACLLGVIFLTCLLMAAVKITRSRRDARYIGNRSVKVPLNDDSPIFDPTSSGLDDATGEVEPDIEVTMTDEVSAVDESTDEAPQIQEAAPVAKLAGEPIFSSEQYEVSDDIQDIETVEPAEEPQIVGEETDEEPTGAISEGLLGEFLGATSNPEFNSESASEKVEAPTEIEAKEIETEAPILEEVSAALNNDDEGAGESDTVAEIDPTESVDFEEEFHHVDQPAYAARASVLTSTTPLFKVAPPSVPDEEPEVVIAGNSDVDDIDPNAEISEVVEAIESEEVAAAAVAVSAPDREDKIALDQAVPVQEVDIALDPTVPIVRPELPEPDFSFEEVPVMEVFEDEEVLGKEITNRISQLDHDLDTIEELVREIESSLANFEPLSGFDEEEKAA